MQLMKYQWVTRYRRNFRGNNFRDFAPSVTIAKINYPKISKKRKKCFQSTYQLTFVSHALCYNLCLVLKKKHG